MFQPMTYSFLILNCVWVLNTHQSHSLIKSILQCFLSCHRCMCYHVWMPIGRNSWNKKVKKLSLHNLSKSRYNSKRNLFLDIPFVCMKYSRDHYSSWPYIHVKTTCNTMFIKRLTNAKKRSPASLKRPFSFLHLKFRVKNHTVNYSIFNLRLNYKKLFEFNSSNMINQVY